MTEEEVHLAKGRECLAGAESELALGRYNNAANRAYYACFHAAIVALLRAGVRRELWSHDEVQSLFAGLLVNRRKLYPSALRSILNSVAAARIMGDYERRVVSRALARGAVRDSERFVGRILGDVS